MKFDVYFWQEKVNATFIGNFLQRVILIFLWSSVSNEKWPLFIIPLIPYCKISKTQFPRNRSPFETTRGWKSLPPNPNFCHLFLSSLFIPNLPIFSKIGKISDFPRLETRHRAPHEYAIYFNAFVDGMAGKSGQKGSRNNRPSEKRFTFPP